jgi:glycosyltransferase involved in cell wall biosynthesis
MRIVYSAPDVSVSDAHGGSAHVKGVIDSFKHLGHDVTLIERKYDLKALRNLAYCSLWPFFYTMYLCLFKKIDVVYERGRIFGGNATIAGKIFGKKTILECIEPYVELPILTGQIKQPLTSLLRFHSRIVNYCSDVITITHESMTKGLLKDKCIIITTGANPERFKPAEDDGKTILYIGSFAPWHAVENMIKAMKVVNEKFPKATLVLVGGAGKETLDKCEQLTKELRLETNIIFFGKVSQEDVPNIINKSIICLALFDKNYLPFREFDYYYSPIKVHEYKACGKPIIASDMGTLKDLVKNNVNGLLVDESNIDEISSAIIKLLKNKKLRDKMGAINRKEVLEKYNWDYVNKQILNRLDLVHKRSL